MESGSVWQASTNQAETAVARANSCRYGRKQRFGAACGWPHTLRWFCAWASRRALGVDRRSNERSPGRQTKSDITLLGGGLRKVLGPLALSMAYNAGLNLALAGRRD